MSYLAQEFLKASLQEKHVEATVAFENLIRSKIALINENLIEVVGYYIGTGQNIDVDQIVEDAVTISEEYDEDEYMEDEEGEEGEEEEGENELREAAMPGKVLPQQLPDNLHLCATKIFHPEHGVGKTIYSEHAEPDENGLIEWYNVDFGDFIVEHVPTNEMKILVAESHMRHKPKNKMKKKK